MGRIKLFDPGDLANITLGQLFDLVTAWAPLDAAMQSAKAEKDRRAAEFDKQNDEQYKLDTVAIAVEHSAGLSQIALVMAKHPEWFAGRGCKERQTDNAIFGYRKKPDKIKVANLEALKDYSDAHGLKLYDTQITAIMAAIKRELKDVAVIPGVKVEKGQPEPFACAIMRNLDESRKG